MSLCCRMTSPTISSRMRGVLASYRSVNRVRGSRSAAPRWRGADSSASFASFRALYRTPAKGQPLSIGSVPSTRPFPSSCELLIWILATFDKESLAHAMSRPADWLYLAEMRFHTSISSCRHSLVREVKNLSGTMKIRTPMSTTQEALRFGQPSDASPFL